MDKFGIGTDATHAEHIEKIKSRSYIGTIEGGRLLPSFLGLALVDGYDDIGFAMSKPDLRANLELGLTAICEGRRTKQDVLEEQINKYKAIFVESERKIDKLSDSLRRLEDFWNYQKKNVKIFFSSFLNFKNLKLKKFLKSILFSNFLNSSFFSDSRNSKIPKKIFKKIFFQEFEFRKFEKKNLILFFSSNLQKFF